MGAVRRPVTFPDRPAPKLSLEEALAAQAAALADLAAAVRQQAAVTEVLVEAMPAATEAKILGVSACTVRRNRARRRNARLLKSTV